MTATAKVFYGMPIYENIDELRLMDFNGVRRMCSLVKCGSPGSYKYALAVNLTIQRAKSDHFEPFEHFVFNTSNDEYDVYDRYLVDACKLLGITYKQAMTGWWQGVLINE